MNDKIRQYNFLYNLFVINVLCNLFNGLELEMKMKYNSAVIKYTLPTQWIKYSAQLIVRELTEAKAAVLSLQSIPYQRSWVESLQQMELKREIAGTSRIEGADFTERELEIALKETQEQLPTRSQKQAHAALQTYRWIAKIADPQPIDQDLILEIHRRMISGADDDHCPPGRFRTEHQNVNFGQPRHRGVEGGDECQQTFANFVNALRYEYPKHDPLIQALAAHYHLAAMHPFLDGNGRTARALEALFLQRAGLRDTCFIAMSNYYYDEKVAYLAALSSVREQNYDLTPFLIFGLKGIALQSRRLLEEIKHQVAKALFRNLMYDLFKRLKTPRKRVIQDRQIEILKLLLESDALEVREIYKKMERMYSSLNNPTKALTRDLNGLMNLKAIRFEKIAEGRYRIYLRLAWPTEITETDFFEKLKQLPKAKSHPFLQ